MHGDSRNRTSTQSLLDGFRAQSDDATRRLIEEHQIRLLSHARTSRSIRGLSPQAAPEDLVAETWMRVLASGTLERFVSQGEGALHAFLVKVLKNVIRDEYRRRGRGKRGGGRRDLSLEGGAWDDGGFVPAMHLFAKDTSPTARACADEMQTRLKILLDDHEWQAWRLCRIEDHTAGEAAGKMERSPASVRGLLHRARMKVLRFLYDQADGPGPEADAPDPPQVPPVGP